MLPTGPYLRACAHRRGRCLTFLRGDEVAAHQAPEADRPAAGRVGAVVMHSTQSPAVTPGRQLHALGKRLLMEAATGGAMNAIRPCRRGVAGPCAIRSTVVAALGGEHQRRTAPEAPRGRLLKR
jgi:hypothetical protein